MSNNATCAYCQHPKDTDRLTLGRDKVTKEEAWACTAHRMCLIPTTQPRRMDKKVKQQVDTYGLFRGA